MDAPGGAGVVEPPDEVPAQVAPGGVEAPRGLEDVPPSRLALPGGLGDHREGAQLDDLAGLVEDVSGAGRGGEAAGA